MPSPTSLYKEVIDESTHRSKNYFLNEKRFHIFLQNPEI
jgi:hypothetical protein